MRRYLILAALLALGACSTDKEIDPPAELTEFPATLKVDRIWSAAVSGSSDPLRLGLGLAVDNERVYAAGRSGEVAAFELANGRPVWRTQTRAPLSGGTGVRDGLVAVASSEGEVIALNQSDGAVRWRVRVKGEVLAAPAVSARAVVVRTVDGRLLGLGPEDGRELWVHEEQVPRLSLRGTSRPTISEDIVLCGFDNGKVVALSVADGQLIWESIVSPAQGRTELERLVDIDSAVRVDGRDVYAVGFQGRAAMLALDTGQLWWGHDASSYRGLGLDEQTVYLATAKGEVVALQRRTGVEMWRQSALLNRGITAAAVGDKAVAVADFEGYVHWLDKTSGALAARASSGGARVTNPPVVAGELLLVINDAGRITAFRTL